MLKARNMYESRLPYAVILIGYQHFNTSLYFLGCINSTTYKDNNYIWRTGQLAKQGNKKSTKWWKWTAKELAFLTPVTWYSVFLSNLRMQNISHHLFDGYTASFLFKFKTMAVFFETVSIAPNFRWPNSILVLVPKVSEL